MAEFVIYKGEAAVRAENVALAAEVKRLRADNARLREMVGEVAPAVEVAPIAAQAIAPRTATAAPNNGETFTVGNCKVSIGAPPPNLPPMNPALAEAREKRMAKQAAARAPALPIAPVPVTAKPQETVDTEPTILRFSMIEPR